jgi:catechol 2,3-dioxygenase-like lactoylglutathione lyase family enzyme
MIGDFQNVNITCRDLERSVRFYERPGLKVIKRVGELNEEGIARGFQLPTSHVRVVYLVPPQASTTCLSTWRNGRNLRPLDGIERRNRQVLTLLKDYAESWGARAQS